MLFSKENEEYVQDAISRYGAGIETREKHAKKRRFGRNFHDGEKFTAHCVVCSHLYYDVRTGGAVN